jgi:hypothetical protein
VCGCGVGGRLEHHTNMSHDFMEVLQIFTKKEKEEEPIKKERELLMWWMTCRRACMSK